MLISEARNFFPYLKTGSIYMNHAAISPLSSLVVEQINKYLNIRSETEVENFADYLKLIAETKEMIGRLINCRPERIAFVDNTSNGLNLLAQGLDWKQGDRIILNDIEFPSNIYPFLNLKEYGVEFEIVKSRNGIVDCEDIEKVITNRTKLVSISFVQFLSGYRADLEKIGELCKKQGIIFCVDAIQGLGAIRLDVEKYKIDYLATGIQKWLMALEGLGFIYITEDLQSRIKQKYVGWTSVKNAWNLLDFKLEFKRNADRFQNGTMSSIAINSLNASLKFFELFGYEEIENTILNNSEFFLSSLKEIGIYPILNYVQRNSLSGIVSFKAENSEEIFKEIQKEKITAAVREGIVRFAPHFYNNKEEIKKVCEVLSGIEVIQKK